LEYQSGLQYHFGPVSLESKGSSIKILAFAFFSGKVQKVLRSSIIIGIAYSQGCNFGRTLRIAMSCQGCAAGFFVFFNLVPSLTAYENVALVGSSNASAIVVKRVDTFLEVSTISSSPRFDDAC
jgi:hypothetical protein